MAHHSILKSTQQQQQQHSLSGGNHGNSGEHSKFQIIKSGSNGPTKDANAKKILHREPGKDVWDYRHNSVFHVPLSSPGGLTVTDCKDGLFGVAKFSENILDLCRAGTRTSNRLSNLLSKSGAFGEVAGQFLQLQRGMEEAMGEVATWVKGEVDTYMKRVSEREDGVKGHGQGPDDLQVLGMGLVLLVQLQQQFFESAAEQLSTFSQRHAVLCGANGLPIDHAKLLSATKNPGATAGEKHLDGRKAGTSPSRLRKQLAGLLSKHKHKSSAQSQWYVNLEKEEHKNAREEISPSSAGQMTNHAPVSQSNSQDTNHLLKDASKSAVSVQKSVPINGSVVLPGGSDPVSQEELDVVIDMLSRATKYAEKDEAAQDQVQPQQMMGAMGMGPVLSKAPGSQLNTTSPNTNLVYDTNVTAPNRDNQSQLPIHHYGHRAAQHRQSDGFISDSNISRESKTNTWPFKPRQKADSNAATWLEAEFSGNNQTFFPQMAGGYPMMLGQDGPAGYVLPPGVPNSRLNALLPGFSSGPWSSAPDEMGNKGWPAFPNIGDGEAVPRQWANMADSSSCSDESSSNGELQQWMMGMNLIEAVNMKRRHSSGGEDTAITAGVGACNINKSVDNLMGNMDPKSTNTWPPKHPWVSKPSDSEEATRNCPPLESMGVIGQSSKGAHRPLMPQWSDPLATRPLAVWESGLTGSLSQQCFSTLPPGGATMEYSPAARIPNPGIPVQDVGKPF